MNIFLNDTLGIILNKANPCLDNLRLMVLCYFIWEIVNT